MALDDRARQHYVLMEKFKEAINGTKQENGKAVLANQVITALLKTVVAMAHQGREKAPTAGDKAEWERNVLMALTLARKEVELGRELTQGELDELTKGKFKKVGVSDKEAEELELLAKLEKVEMVH